MSLLLQRFSLLSQAADIPNLGINLTVFAMGGYPTTANSHPPVQTLGFLILEKINRNGTNQSSVISVM